MVTHWLRKLLLHVWPIISACGVLSATGCGGGVKHYPVVGKATIDGKPLTGLVIEFNPDPGKGWTNTRFTCNGELGADGQYSLTANYVNEIVKGAPAGWYKVTVSIAPGVREPVNFPVARKFTDFAKTTMTIEVVPEPQPGAYDLSFSRK